MSLNENLILDSSKAFSYYPDKASVDHWVENIIKRLNSTQVTAQFLDFNPVKEPFGNNPNTLINKYIQFTSNEGHSFWGYWQPAHKSPSPLLINLPGYGGCISNHPQINDDGYHILHIAPLGYVTPTSINDHLFLDSGKWPVLHNTAMGLAGGYEDWLLDCLLALSWAEKLPEVNPTRISLFGTSQGGGTALLLTSILPDKFKCVCADLPFLTGFPLTNLQGDAYNILQESYSLLEENVFWKNLGYIDTLSHAHRIKIPTMLSSGGMDTVCPSSTIEELFKRLNCTKQYTYLSQGVHTHSRESMFLFRSWLALFA